MSSHVKSTRARRGMLQKIQIQRFYKKKKSKAREPNTAGEEIKHLLEQRTAIYVRNVSKFIHNLFRVHRVFYIPLEKSCEKLNRLIVSSFNFKLLNKTHGRGFK